jgi:hypothetical protein
MSAAGHKLLLMSQTVDVASVTQQMRAGGTYQPFRRKDRAYSWNQIQAVTLLLSICLTSFLNYSNTTAD